MFINTLRFEGTCKPALATSLLTCAELIFHGDIPSATTPLPTFIQSNSRNRRSEQTHDSFHKQKRFVENVIEDDNPSHPPDKNSFISRKFCPPVDPAEVSPGRRVLQRMTLPSLYDNKGGAVLFDCRHIQDNKLYSIKLFADVDTSVPIQAFSDKFTVRIWLRCFYPV